MAEWFKAHAWKVCVLSKVPWVRIPLSPPKLFITFYPIYNGGESGIRTHERVSPKHAFQACALNHSAISPKVTLLFVLTYFEILEV